MTGPSSKFAQTLGRLQQPDAAEPANPQAGKPASPQASEPANPPATAETDPREKYTTRLPKSVVKAVKQLGLDTEQPDYAVVEAAIREYLAKHGR